MNSPKWFGSTDRRGWIVVAAILAVWVIWFALEGFWIAFVLYLLCLLILALVFASLRQRRR